jgi:hypothetical protein
MAADLRTLVAAERGRPEPGAAERAQAWDALALRVAQAAPVAAAAGAHAAGRFALGRAWRGLGVAFAVGAVAGSAATWATSRAMRSEAHETSTGPSATRAAPRVIAPAEDARKTESAGAIVAFAELPPAPPAGVPPSASRGIGTDVRAAAVSDDALRRERALVDRARTAIERGDRAAAAAALAEHARAFPDGRLTEESEFLAILALLGDAKSDEARAQAARFHAAHPESLLGPAIDAALSRARRDDGAIP